MRLEAADIGYRREGGMEEIARGIDLKKGKHS